MRKSGLGLLTVLALGFGIETAAADILRALYSPHPVASWTNFYVGGNIGYGWARGSATTTIGGVSNTVSGDLDGVIGGGQIGLNAQFGSWVLGVESDIQLSGQKLTLSGVSGGLAFTETHKITWFGTTRARAGIAAERMLIYATGGVGYGEAKSSLTVAGLGTVSVSKVRLGWALGGGVEGMITPAWSWKAEYIYFDTGNFTDNVFGVPIRLRLKDNIVRFGVNYRFR
jgi:outer membrane immunogenic protein